MPEKISGETGKTQADLKKAIRRDWVEEHKGALIGVGACVVAASAAIALVVARPWVSGAHVLDQAAAIVDGDRITEQEVADYIDKYRRYIGKTSDADWATFMDENSTDASTMRTNALTRLEQQRIIMKAAAEAGISATAEEIDEKVASERERAGLADDDEGWNAWLDSMGYAPDEYRKEMEYGIIERKYIDTQVAPTEPTDWYMQSEAEADAASWTGRKGYRVLFELDGNATASQVLEAEGKANDFIASLGDDVTREGFVKAAGELRGKGVKAQEMQWDCLADYDVAYQEALDGLSAGEMTTEPVRTAKGYIVVYCLETYLAGDDGSIDMSTMPEAIAKALREKAYEDVNKDPRDSYLYTIVYTHSIDEKDMPDGLPYDVDMSQSTYYEADDGTASDGTTTITSDSGDTEAVVTLDGDGEASGAIGDEGDGSDAEPAVSPSDPTTMQTYADYDAGDAEEE